VIYDSVARLCSDCVLIVFVLYSNCVRIVFESVIVICDSQFSFVVDSQCQFCLRECA